jgi:glutamate carboxypeptidase
MQVSSDDRVVLDLVAAREDEIVSRAVTWSSMPSGTRNLEGLEAQAAELRPLLESFGGTLTTIPLPATLEVADDGGFRELRHGPAMRLTLRPEAPVQVVMTGHYDTVYPVGSAFTAVTRRADGALNGPGIADMKGGISVMLAALEAFETHPLKHGVGVTVLLSPDEEIGSPASAPLLAEAGAQGHLGLTYEPALADGALAAARKGSANYHLVIRGRSAHAGRALHEGRNAVLGAARIAERLHALNGDREGVGVNVASIVGGGALNVVPETAVLRFNIRAPDAASALWAEEAVLLATRDPGEGLTVSLNGGFTRPAKPFDGAQVQLFQAVREVGELLGQSLAWKDSGGVCEGNNLHAAGLPNVDTLGVRGGDIHSEAEHAFPDSFVERAQLSALILMKLASGEIDAHAIRALRETA